MPLNVFFCPHCSRFISRTVYFKHKRWYFSRKNGSWTKEKIRDHIGGPSFSLEDSSFVRGLNEDQEQFSGEEEGKYKITLITIILVTL